MSNQGTDTAGANTLRFYLSADNQITREDILLAECNLESLASNARQSCERNARIPSGTAQGIWYLGAIADAGNAVAESDETNNSRAVAVSVTSPLSCPLVTDPGIPRPGDIDYKVQYVDRRKLDARYNVGLSRFAASVSSDVYSSSFDDYARTLCANGFDVAPLVEYPRVSDPDLSRLAIDVNFAGEQALQAVVGVKNVQVDGQRRRAIVIAFRGSKEKEDWILNVIHSSEHSFNGVRDLNAHAGFLSFMKAFERKESEVIINGVSLATMLEQARANGDLVLVTGHSLGGAVANLYAARLHDRGVPRDQLQVYTFGQPAAGNRAFADYYFNADPYSSAGFTKLNHFRVRNIRDAVPYITHVLVLKEFAEEFLQFLRTTANPIAGHFF